tara:strand:- start:926 stop:1741 length:816 start_codon:yes stop_codon:yes gene_type:complete
MNILNTSRSLGPVTAAAMALFVLANEAQAQSTPSETAKELHNPLSNLKEVIFQMDVLPNVGPYDKTDWVTTVQPVYPFALPNDWKLVTYSIIPVASQPGMGAGDGRSFGLGDSTFFGYFVPPNEGSIIWGFGPALQAPTHTDDTLGIDKWAAGPALIVGAQPGNWSIFGLFDNVWSFAGSDTEDISLFNFQYQAVRLLADDWFFITNWTMEADWEAPSAEQWTIPVGGGFGKQFKIGEHQFQAYGQLGYNVVRPDDEAATWRGIVALTWVF